jgi:transposase
MLLLVMIVYNGSLEDSGELIQFFRREADKLKALRKLVVNREKTVVWDVNKDGIEFRGLTYGCASLDELLRELGIVFNPKTLHNPQATPTGVKEFDISAKWTWGHDRVL